MIWAIIVKDLKLMLRDRKALIITLLMPAVLTAILGLSIGKMLIGGSDAISPAEVAIVNLDDRASDVQRIREFLDGSVMKQALGEADRVKVLHSLEEMDLEQILYRDVLENDEVKKFIRYRVTDRQAAEEGLRQGKFTAVVVLPPGFLYDVLINLITPFRNQVTLEVIKHPDQTFKGEIVEGILRGFTDTVSAGIIAKNTFLEAAIENNLGRRAYRELEGVTRRVMDTGLRDVQVRYLDVTGMRKISGFEYYAAAMATMFILFTAGYGARYLIGERRMYTYERMLLGNVRRSSILAGRFAATFLFSYAQILILVAFSSLIFKIWWGHLPDLLLYNLLVAAAVAALTVLVSGINLLANDERASNIFESLVVNFMAIVGGSFFPTKILPASIASLGTFTPNGNALNGYLKLMQGYRLPDLSGNIVTMVLIACVLLSGGIAVVQAGKE